MNRVIRRIVFWLLLAGYTAACGWWMLTVPHDPDRLIKSIPGHATIVTYHENLAGRWDEISRSPLIRMLAGVMGANPQEWSAMSNDPGFRAFLNMAAREEVLLAYVPRFTVGDGGDWMMASWIGGMSQRLRWTDRWLNIEGVVRAKDVGGWPVWTWSWRSKTGEQQVTIVLAEGVMLATSSRDPQTLRVLVDSYNGNFPSVHVRADRKVLMQQLAEANEPDRGWYTPPSFSGRDYWMVGFDHSASNRVTGTMRTPRPGAAGFDPINPDWTGLSGFWSDLPLAVIATGMDPVLLAIDQQPGSVPILMMRELLVRSGAGTVALALFGGEFRGQIKGIKIPALMAALQTTAPVDLATLIPPMIDRWNRIHKLGLVMVPQQAGDTTVWRLEGTAGGLYGNLSASEQVALAVRGPWLLVSSNCRTLEKLLERDPDEPGRQRPLLEELNAMAGADSIGCASFDLVRGAEAVRFALAAYSLKLLYEDSRGSRDRREKINEAKAWLDSLALMKNLRVRAREGNDILQFDFEVGAGEPAL